tara:strand:+ start:322 stop:534 length:213 start_codon:yes stop_codon:yes gene_type:complete
MILSIFMPLLSLDRMVALFAPIISQTYMQSPEKHVLTRHLVTNFEKSYVLMRFHLEKCQSVLFDKTIILG